MRRLGLLAVGLTIGALGFAGSAWAVTLVHPDGSPVGGQWQAWVNEMRVPSVSGTLVFEDPSQLCVGYATGIATPLGCSTPTAIAAAPGPLARSTLYFELGHQFDWRYLTNADREYLARAWGASRWYWSDSNAAVSQGFEDGLEGMFPMIYGDSCALGIDDNGSEWAAWPPVGYHGSLPPSLLPRINTCAYLDRIAERVRADMESAALAPWNHRMHKHSWYVSRAGEPQHLSLHHNL